MITVTEEQAFEIIERCGGEKACWCAEHCPLWYLCYLYYTGEVLE